MNAPQIAMFPASLADRYLGPTTVRGVTEDMAMAREEVRGLVLSALTFESIEKALRIANDTPYGLSAGVWSANIDTRMSVARDVRPGTVWVNTFMEDCPELPFGGYKRSGLGRELGKRDRGLYRGNDSPVSSRPAHRMVGRLS